MGRGGQKTPKYVDLVKNRLSRGNRSKSRFGEKHGTRSIWGQKSSVFKSIGNCSGMPKIAIWRWESACLQRYEAEKWRNSWVFNVNRNKDRRFSRIFWFKQESKQGRKEANEDASKQ